MPTDSHFYFCGYERVKLCRPYVYNGFTSSVQSHEYICIYTVNIKLTSHYEKRKCEYGLRGNPATQTALGRPRRRLENNT
jgi:hypothetical protein